LRLRDPQKGEIRLGGRNLADYADVDVRRLVSTVPWRTHVFNDTLRNNLLLASPQTSEEALELALERAQISGFVERLPEGLDIYVGVQGTRLSGGERQRLAVAPTSSYAPPVASTPACWKLSRSCSWSHGLPEYRKVPLPGSVSADGLAKKSYRLEPQSARSGR
jgi:hypothetical protein